MRGRRTVGGGLRGGGWGEEREAPHGPGLSRGARALSRGPCCLCGLQWGSNVLIRFLPCAQVAITDGTVALLDVTAGVTLFSRRVFAESGPPGAAPRQGASLWSARLRGCRPPPSAMAVRISPDCSRIAATAADNTVEARGIACCVTLSCIEAHLSHPSESLLAADVPRRARR